MSAENGARIIILLHDVSQAYYKLIRGGDTRCYHTASVVCGIILTVLSVDVIILSVCCLFVYYIFMHKTITAKDSRSHLNSDYISADYIFLIGFCILCCNLLLF